MGDTYVCIVYIVPVAYHIEAENAISQGEYKYQCKHCPPAQKAHETQCPHADCLVNPLNIICRTIMSSEGAGKKLLFEWVVFVLAAIVSWEVILLVKKEVYLCSVF